ncbi:hypothetical protein WSM22_02550 [Cytophagales bacterium WSM2-2]|nr:hypothetical protein WSM22_02550 [Cytophagales bacterium WSM2-2]
MNFTLKEYFYKLSNRSLILMLLPIVAFLSIYYLLLSGILPTIVRSELWVVILLTFVPIAVLISLTIVHLGLRSECKIIGEEVGLGRKLELFYPVAKRKINSLVWASFVLAGGFFLTAHEWFSIYFGVVIVWSWVQWPSPRRACNDLNLKGDEREMVMSKGEAFKM